jgi:hypothetical protein
LNNAGWPKHAHGIRLVMLAETKDQISRSGRRRGGIDFQLLVKTAGAHFDLCFDRAAVADVAVYLNLERMIAIAAIVAENVQLTISGAHDQIDITIVVKITR